MNGTVSSLTPENIPLNGDIDAKFNPPIIVKKWQPNSGRRPPPPPISPTNIKEAKFHPSNNMPTTATTVGNLIDSMWKTASSISLPSEVPSINVKNVMRWERETHYSQGLLSGVLLIL